MSLKEENAWETKTGYATQEKEGEWEETQSGFEEEADCRCQKEKRNALKEGIRGGQAQEDGSCQVVRVKEESRG